MKEQTEVRTLKEGRYVMIDDEPCVIKSISHSKPGKHGSAKARIDAIGIFDNQKRSMISPVTAKVYVPVVERRSGQVLSITNNVAQIMDLEDYSNFEMKIPEELAGKIEEGKEITYLRAMGKTKFDIRT
jgi:translation initiation factor 5A